MGMVCENCGWRRNPSDNTGKGCVFANNKKKWDEKGYNKPCDKYVMDIELAEHLRVLLKIEK